MRIESSNFLYFLKKKKLLFLFFYNKTKDNILLILVVKIIFYGFSNSVLEFSIHIHVKRKIVIILG